jgi:hypothetical protein
MANYGISNSTSPGPAGVAQNACTATYQAGLGIAASSGGMVGPPVVTGLRRGKIYDILVGTNGTPADTYVEYSCARATVGTTVVWLGSVSSVSSAYAMDLGDVGHSAFVVMNTSAQTNIVANTEVWYVGVNQRASYRWVAAPGSELVYPAVSSATGNNGLALRFRGSNVTTVTNNVLWQEQ